MSDHLVVVVLESGPVLEDVEGLFGIGEGFIGFENYEVVDLICHFSHSYFEPCEFCVDEDEVVYFSGLWSGFEGCPAAFLTVLLCFLRWQDMHCTCAFVCSSGSQVFVAECCKCLYEACTQTISILAMRP